MNTSPIFIIFTMKRDIHIKFVDFWPTFDEKDNFITNLLAKKYNVIFSENPTYLIFSLFGYENLNYNCVKIFFTGENNTPNFDICDYAIGFNHLSFQDRYIRIPLYVVDGALNLIQNEKIIDREKLLNRKFCSFVFSNKDYADSTRVDFFHILSKYKKIDSGGALLNNMNGRVPDKLAFIKDYKFNIAFENSSFDGYTTEKLVDPMIVNSLPIYWGNPTVGLEFNEKSFINASDFKSLEELANYVVYLDENDDAYIEKLSEPWLTQGSLTDWKEKLTEFLCHIIDQDVTKAKRTPLFGWVLDSNYKLKRFVYQDNLIAKNRRAYRYFGKLMSIYNRIKRLIK